MVRKSADFSDAAVPLFLTKCYDMVDDESTEGVISWGKAGNSFIIHDMTQFSVNLLPKYFKHNNFSSFMRQLNIYGFRKIDSERWEFANEAFLRGHKYLLRSITRRRHSAAHPADDRPRPVLVEEVQSLKADRNALMQELVKLRQHHEHTKDKILHLKDHLHGMEETQSQLLSFLLMLMQALHKAKGKSVISDGILITYQDEGGGGGDESSAAADASFQKVKELLMNFNFPKMPMDEKVLSARPDHDELLRQILSSSERVDDHHDESATATAGGVDESGTHISAFEKQMEEFVRLTSTVSP